MMLAHCDSTVGFKGIEVVCRRYGINPLVTN